MKPTLRTIGFLALSSGLASAATYSVISSYVDTSFKSSAGAFLDSSYTAYIGVTSAVLTNADNYATINAGWTPVSAAAIAFQSSAGGYAGYFTGTYTYSTSAGQPIVLWVTDGANQNFVATLGQVFANPLAAPFDNNTFDIKYANHTSGVTIKLGSFAEGTDGFNGTGGNFILNNATPVPEPSAALLGALGVIGLLRRRRV